MTEDTSIKRTRQYRLDELLAGITPENVHPETATGSTIGKEFGSLEEQVSEPLPTTEDAEESFAAVEVLSVAFRLLLGEKIGVEHPYGWMQVFDFDELQDLIKEVTQVYRSATSSTIEWSEVEATIHEWHESALAIASPEIAAAFNDEFDKINAANLPRWKPQITIDRRTLDRADD